MIDEHIIPTFPDERFSPLEVSGLVDCFACGRKVSILDSFKLVCQAGPTGHLHKECMEGKTWNGLFRFYNKNVLSAVKNISPK